MTTRHVGGVRKFVDRHFPERQIYHRSRGAVQFITLTARAQICLMILTFAFLGWVAYASVNAVFKDQIIAAREQHFATIQAAYEGRLAEMQAALDDVNGALVMTQERFSAATTELETKHRQLSEILNRQEEAMREMGALRERLALAYRTIDAKPDGNQVVMTMADVEALPGQSRTQGDRMGGPLGALFGHEPTPAWAKDTSAGMPKPFAEDNQAIRLRMANLEAAQRQVVAEIEQKAKITIVRLENVVSRTGLNVERVLERVNQDGMAQGGPYAPLGPKIQSKASKSDYFAKDVVRLATTIDRLTGLRMALSSIPLLPPLEFVDRYASGFGRRSDPFTGRPAFHYGLDMVSPFKTPVHAASAGRVTIAGRNGPYGNLVEIDHGNGMRTRYGHLHSISVKVGDQVAYGQTVGLLGSTGRSTGPHLHYEVRFNGTLRNPAQFLEAGRYVLQE